MNIAIKRKKTKEKLSTLSIYGFQGKIQKLLESKGINISQAKISDVLNIDKTKWDNDVIAAALEICEAQEEIENQIHDKISGL